MADNDIEYRVNVSSAQAALRSLEQAAANVGKTAAKGGKEASDALAQFEAVVKRAGTTFESVNDRAYQSNQRYLASLEKRVALEGKSGTERLIAERDQLSKRFGQNAEQLQRFNAQYEKLIALERSHSSSASGQNATNILRGARDLFEGRMAYGEVQIAKGLGLNVNSLSGMGLAVAGVSAAVIGLSVAGYKAAESFAAWGTEQSNIQQKLGLTARELGTLNFAARATGQEIGSVERVMRGIAVATEDFSPAGNKAREAFAAIGFSLQDANGNAKPFGQTLLELSAAIDKMPPGTERAAFVLETLKRSGIESIPVLHELADAYKRVGAGGINIADQSSIDNAKQMNERLAEMGQNLDHLVLRAKEYVATGFFMSLDFVQHAGNTPGRRSPDFLDDNSAPVAGPSAGYAAAGLALGRYRVSGIEGVKQAESDAKSAMDKAMVQLQLDAGNKQIGIGKVGEDVATLTAKTAEYEKQKALAESITKSTEAQKNAVESLRRLTVAEQERVAHPYGLLPADKELLDLMKGPGFNLSTQQGAANAQAAQATLAPRRAQEIADIVRKAQDQGNAELHKIYDEYMTGKLYGTTEGRVADHGFTLGLSQQRTALEDQVKYLEKAYRESTAFDTEVAQGRGRIERTLGGKSDTIQAAQDTATERKAILDDTYRFEMEKVDAVSAYIKDADDRRMELRLEHDRNVAKVEIELAEQVATRERQQLDSIKKDATALYTTLFEHPSKFPHQLATVARTAALSPLIGGLSEGTARLLHPLIYGESGTGGLAGASRSIFGGATVSDGALHVKVVGGGTIGGGTSMLDVMLKTPASAASTSASTSGTIADLFPRWLTTFGPASTKGPLGSLPFGAPASYSMGSGGGFGLSMGGGMTSMLAGIAPFLLGSQVLNRSGGPAGSVSSSISFPGGDQGVDLGTSFVGGGVSPVASDLGGLGSLTFPGSSSLSFGRAGGSSGGFNPLSLLGGGRTAGGLKLPSLAALKSSFYNPNINTGAGSAVAASSLGPLGNLAGVLTSPAAGQLMTSVGLPLALAGLTGVNRGTGTGIGEATAGGALTGAGIGTMILPGIGTAIGAGVGAAAGLLAGGLEDLLGVQSDRQKAIEQVKQIYHINISNSTADQIAKIAQSKYGDNVSIAVRSPEVRQMLGLYAAGTGQASKFPQSADIPMGGSLVSQGGVLQQSPVYQYGNPYTYSSSLPVAGGNAGGNLPNPGGSTIASASFNIGGASVASFMNGEVFTPEATANNVQTAYNSSAGRTQASMTIQDPTGIVG